MNPKTKIKLIVDCLMTVLLLTLMAYHVTGNRVHEWLGAFLFLLFILHNLLNWKWYKTILNGKYTAVSFLQKSVNLLLLASMVGMMVSGVMVSHVVFDFLDIRAGRLGRKLHMISTAWGFLLMAVHLGLHWDTVIGTAKKLTKKPAGTASYTAFTFRLAAAVLPVYGIYAFISRQVWQEMFLLVEFAFFDYKEPVILFFIDYTAIMVLFVWLAYYGKKMLRGRSQTNIQGTIPPERTWRKPWNPIGHRLSNCLENKK